MNFSPGDKVGLRGYGNSENTIVAGPFTIDRRPTNPHNQHMWTFVNKPSYTAESRLFHWKDWMKVGDKISNQRPLNNVIRRKAEHQVQRELWENITKTNSAEGSGPLNTIRGFLGQNIKGTRSKNPGIGLNWKKVPHSRKRKTRKSRK